MFASSVLLLLCAASTSMGPFHSVDYCVFKKEPVMLVNKIAQGTCCVNCCDCLQHVQVDLSVQEMPLI